jgi:DNA excision repair protein ERCC-4
MASLKPEQLTALVDTREKLPFDLSPLWMEIATLTTGDYSIKGLQDVIAVERKSLPDLLGCVGQHRDRFERELQRLLAFPARCVVVEAGWADIEAGAWANKLTPKQVSGSIAGWIAQGVPFVLCDSRDRAAWFTSRFLFIAARRRLREVEAAVKAVA